MKMLKQLHWMAAAGLLVFAASCQDDNFAEDPKQESLTDVYGSGSNIVELTLDAQMVVGTRDGEDATVTKHISDGSDVNVLFFQVYDLGESSTDNTVTSSTTDLVPLTAMDVTSFPVRIKLAVNPDHNYVAAFWAQHATKNGTDYNKAPFTFTNLTEVKVDYSNAVNNDDLRDAFCATKDFTGTATDISVILHRPFAQLNVGTTGADYKNYMAGNILPTKTIKYSKVVVKGVYNTIDVANDEIKGEEEDAVTFTYAKIPAYMNYTDFPTTFLESLTDLEDGYVTETDKEEFLKVNLNNPTTANSDLLGYKITYPTIDEDAEGGKYLTETFKYMSMCYVLVPSSTTATSTPSNTANSYDTYNSSSLESVSVYFGESATDGQQYFTINNVPVHRNWRTNLLGGLYNPDDSDTPDTPDDPDDPSSLFWNVKIAVQLCPIYFGEYNGQYDPSDEENGYEGIFEGYFPTGENDQHNNHGQHTTTN